MSSSIGLLYLVVFSASVAGSRPSTSLGATLSEPHKACESKGREAAVGSPKLTPDSRLPTADSRRYLTAQGQASASDPDALYRDRENLASAKQAAATWAARLEGNPKDFEAAWKLAKAQYWLGTNGLPQAERRAALEAGIAAARAAVTIEPDQPEGHFWIAASMGALAEGFGMRQGLKYRGDIRDELQIALKLDAAFMQGSADRALGRWYYKVPGLFGGSKQKSEEHLRKALAYNPQSIITHLFLAETLVELGRKDDARKALDAAMTAPLDPEWTPEDRRFKEQAKQLLAKLSR